VLLLHTYILGKIPADSDAFMAFVKPGAISFAIECIKLVEIPSNPALTLHFP